jgi:cell division protein FtsB
MIDVHPPHKRIHGVGEFFLHLLTITIGLLIALALENAAGAVHHRHQEQEAEATIREEMAENREHLVEANATIKSELDNLNATLDYLEARSQGKDASTAGITMGLNMIRLQNAGWRTAAATGAVQYMNYTAVQQFAQSYDLQDVFNGLQSQTLDNYLNLISHIAAKKDSKGLTPQEAEAAMPDVRVTMAHLGAMRDLSGGLLKSYDEALK